MITEKVGSRIKRIKKSSWVESGKIGVKSRS